MITVQAPSRLHFGLFNLAGDTHWPNSEGKSTLPARHFGGVGLMVRDPGVRVTVRPAISWSAEGPLADRALEYAQRLSANLPSCFAPEPQHIVIEQCAAEHIGLGTGTQLALAVGRAVTASCGDLHMETTDLGKYLGRGARSALGIHGFENGGLIVEAGKADPKDNEVSPLAARISFPHDWRIVLVVSPWSRGFHGTEERQAFQELQERPTPPSTTDALCRLALLGMLPALAEHDLISFGEALYDFNRRVGELFAPAQGGTYCHPRTAELVSYFREQGVRGVGQSSWGPTVFAISGDEGTAGDLVDKLRTRFAPEPIEVVCTTACNSGATVQLTADD
jgi:beta-RFAP synthase